MNVRNPTLHLRLVATAVLGTAIAVAVAAVGTWLIASTTTWNRFDQQLDRRVEQLQGLARLRDGTVRFPAGTFDGVREEAVVVSNVAGHTVFAYGTGLDVEQPRSRTVRWLAQPFRPPPQPAGKASPERDRPVAAPDEPAQELVLTLTRSATGQRQDLRALGWLLAGTWMVATVLSALVAWLLTRAALRPVARLASTIGGISPESPPARDALGAADAPPELAVVADRLGGLLQRVDEALRRERQTAALLAHELRTPIAGLRATLEFALARSRQPDADAEDLRACQSLTMILGETVEGLLLFTRLERGLIQSDPHWHDPIQVVREAKQTLIALGHEHLPDIQVSAEPDPPAQVLVDRALVLLVVRNLLVNAVQHGDPGKPITLVVTVHPGVFTLRIRNAVRPQPTAAREVHAQLGLPLCRRIMTLVGGSLTEEATAEAFTITCTWKQPVAGQG